MSYSGLDLLIIGVTVRIESNIDACLSAAKELYGPEVPIQGKPSCFLRIMSRKDPLREERLPGIQWSRSDRARLTIRAPGLDALVHLSDGLGVVHVDEAFVADTPQFRRTVLEGIVACLLVDKDRFPVHASAVMRDGAAVLFCGASGVGKSTLAFVAHRAGLDVLADDAVRVQRSGEFRLWGDAGRPRVHLLEHLRDDFPDLERRMGDRLSANGVLKMSVDVPLKCPEAAPYATAGRVCLVARIDGRIGCSEVSDSEIQEELMRPEHRTADLYPERRAAVVEALARGGGWRLSLSGDAHDALPHIYSMLGGVQTTRATVPH